MKGWTIPSRPVGSQRSPTRPVQNWKIFNPHAFLLELRSGGEWEFQHRQAWLRIIAEQSTFDCQMTGAYEPGPHLKYERTLEAIQGVRRLVSSAGEWRHGSLAGRTSVTASKRIEHIRFGNSLHCLSGSDVHSFGKAKAELIRRLFSMTWIGGEGGIRTFATI